MSFQAILTDFVDDFGVEKQVIAKALEVSPATISGYLKGTSAPTWSDLPRVSDVLGLSLDYMAGRTTTNKWSPELQTMRPWLRARVPEIQAPDLMVRMVRVAELMREYSATCRQDWWMAGLLKLPLPAFHLFMARQGTVNAITLSRLSDLTGLPEDWLMEGDPADLVSTYSLGDYHNIVLRLARDGISPTELHQNYDWLLKRIQLVRRPGSPDSDQ